MTREEAITYLEDAKSNLPYKFEQAIDMAIEALQADAAQGVGRYEKAIKTLQEMPRYLNGIKAKQIKKISAEAVRGEWIRKEKEINDCDEHRAFYWYECDQCGSRPPRNEYTKQEWLSNFCPNCGAKMKGGAE